MSRTPSYVLPPAEHVPDQPSVGVDPAALRDAMPDALATMARTPAQTAAAIQAATQRPGDDAPARP